MTTISSIKALEVLDSRGVPTIYLDLFTKNGIHTSACVPSGASTGTHEAHELRDNDPHRYCGKGVLKAVENINGPLQKLLMGKNVVEQQEIDYAMIELDGTENKAHLGANAILAISLAVARAGAKASKLPLYHYLSASSQTPSLPCPMMNIINGGAHADNLLDFQEFMIRPLGIESFHEKLRAGAEIFQSLKKILKKKGQITSVGDEGGFAPHFSSNEEALDVILEAIEKAGYCPKKQISMALDTASSEFYDKSTKTYIEKKKRAKNLPFKERTSLELTEYFAKLTSSYPIDSLEDPLHEEDWEGWQNITKQLGGKIQIIGDDLLVTNKIFLERAVKEKAANGILIKLNQIGTVTETLETILYAQKNNFHTIISHRSGETEDTFIADLAVATGAKQIKTGSLSRSDRIAKYNRLLVIESRLGICADE
jgi:enolase